MIHEPLAVSRVVSRERAEKRETEQVRYRSLREGTANNRKDSTVAAVDSLTSLRPPLVLRVSPKEPCSFQQLPLARHLEHEPHLVTILQVLAHAFQRNGHFHANVLQVIGRPDAAQHEQLWRIECAARQNHLASSSHRA